MEHRDRATGWQHAKLSGHKNEDLVKMRLDADEVFAASLLKRINQPHAHIAHTTIGGLHETNVPSVNGRKTKSKTAGSTAGLQGRLRRLQSSKLKFCLKYRCFRL